VFWIELLKRTDVTTGLQCKAVSCGANQAK